MKKSFVLYSDTYETIKKLSEKEQAELLRAIFEYHNNGITQELSITVDLVFSFMKSQFDRDNDKWHAKKEVRSEAGRLGGLAKQANARLAKQNKQSLANQAVNVNVNVNDNVKGNGYLTKNPTLAQCRTVPSLLTFIEKQDMDSKDKKELKILIQSSAKDKNHTIFELHEVVDSYLKNIYKSTGNIELYNLSKGVL